LSLGIHEAVEIKENVDVGGETNKEFYHVPKLFTLYPKLAGMTGTGTTEKEFQDIYNLK
jgi:preprotein translocase subunit SecA